MGEKEFAQDSRRITRGLRLTLIFFALVQVTLAQEARSTAANTLPSSLVPTAQSTSEEENFIKPSRPSIANPAEIQEAGALQLECGYDGNFRAENFRSQQTAPLALRYATTRRLLLEFDLDTVISERSEEDEPRMTGVGDTRLGFQIVALEDSPCHPALAFAYYVKLPTAREEEGPGTGRVDHRIAVLLSKRFGETDLDFNAAYLNVGREDGDGRESGGQAAVAVSREFQNNFGFEVELAGQSEDDVQPRGIFALGALTYRANKRLRFDGGLRFGLNPNAPRVGVFAGVTVGLGRLRRRR